MGRGVPNSLSACILGLQGLRAGVGEHVRQQTTKVQVLRTSYEI